MKKYIWILFLLHFIAAFSKIDSEKNLIRDSKFSEKEKEWGVSKKFGAKGEYYFKDDYFEAVSQTPNLKEEYGFQFYQENLKFQKGGIYKISFEAESEEEEKLFVKVTGTNARNWKTYLYKKLEPTPGYQRYQYIFSIDKEDNGARLEFWLTRLKTKTKIKNITMELIDVYDVKDVEKERDKISEKIGERKLIWKEEFDYEGGLKKEYWVHELGGSGWGNEELQSYTSSIENSYVKDGTLHVVADYNKATNKFTSARVITKGLKNFKYGYFEVSAKLPSGKGTWPAIWLYGAGRRYSEIDIMEHIGAETGIVHFSTHTSNQLDDLETHRTAFVTVTGATTDFQIYGLEWTSKYIRGFVNGVEYFNLYKEDFPPDFWQFDENMFIILNLAVGGTWGGVNGVDYKSFPQTFLIDYVRVYEY